MSKIYTDGWHLVKGRNDAILVKDGKLRYRKIGGIIIDTKGDELLILNGGN